MHFFRYIALFLAGIALPQSAFAAAPKNFEQLAGELINILNLSTLTLIISGFAVYFWGIIGLLQNSLFGGTLFNPSTGGENPAGKTETPWNYYGIGDN